MIKRLVGETTKVQHPITSSVTTYVLVSQILSYRLRLQVIVPPIVTFADHKIQLSWPKAQALCEIQIVCQKLKHQ
jgi:hypothetical protein